jgi:hypothetical protein
MKPAEKYLKELFKEPLQLEDENSIDYDFLQLIKQAQIDAIEETCRVCADRADITDNGRFPIIDKQSILLIADKLKKELNENT